MAELITVIYGSTFMISDSSGDVVRDAGQGLFFEDSRFLSRLELKLNGSPLRLLSSQVVDPFSARFYLSNPELPMDSSNEPAAAIPVDSLVMVRDRFVGDGLHEDFTITSYGKEPVRLTLDLLLEADFAHIFQVKTAPHLRHNGAQKYILCEENWVEFASQEGDRPRRCHLSFSQTAVLSPSGASFSFILQPRESWHTCLNVYTLVGEEERPPRWGCDHFGKEKVSSSLALQQWLNSIPRLFSDCDALNYLYRQSAADLATLRIFEDEVGGLAIPAAGSPWFMAVFGRDSLITGYQSLILSSQMALGALTGLARYQGQQTEESSEEEPGKIPHEIRHRGFTYFGGGPREVYYGTVDATPLFLVLLSEMYRWGIDQRIIQEFLPQVESALRWIEEWGDKDGDGYVEYSTARVGMLRNNGWKDSDDAIQFADGKVAEGPIALCEVQGYVYDAWLRMAELWEDFGRPQEAARLRAKAASLKRRFNLDFWISDKNGKGFFALALDGDKNKVDALASNMGHLL
ncbi:amylo-alpha-1,6-glucosidase [Candidatus Hakubella thermalkaliphila]|uniref:Putative glycogen debranching enzyme N-terminal domain-containing protein n=3 Tax=Candidatus Hakubella thermalkaliphila TaxID=2754717 RepID=A0A6V8PGS1_9ACTN|nr:glycogen debranching N-terminal domain-containing protein [Candidatus Hakubella thermalkaliphila]GFP30126.1 hypothetical protein HKBW3S34_01046 [Candidatus Hakubella thermalkaliphila]GFP39627.1 hypothetical protein HKBW3S47_01325 [Candidatus Hakubella thermalkaliphila]GFP41901.1 hypothetical protein HKBW3C_01028 [Candidatus Hakubella thermalkaliphila]